MEDAGYFGQRRRICENKTLFTCTVSYIFINVCIVGVGGIVSSCLTDCGDVDAPGEVECFAPPLVVDGAVI